MRPPSVYANPACPAHDPCDLLHLLHGPHRVGCRLVMILLSQQGLAASQIAGLLGYDPSTVRRWIHRYQRHGTRGLADRPRSGRPRLGSPRLAQRIRRLLAQPKAWTIGRLHQRLGRPTISLRILHGARYSPHDNPIERIWGALKTYLANSPTLTIQGRVRQVHAFFRTRSPAQLLATARRTAPRGCPTVTCNTMSGPRQPWWRPPNCQSWISTLAYSPACT
jgi:transposase-like protein